MHDADQQRLLESYRAHEVPHDVERDRLLARLLASRGAGRSGPPRTALAIGLACAIAAIALLVLRAVASLLDTSTATAIEQSIDERAPDAPAPVETRAAIAEPPALPNVAPPEPMPPANPIVETPRRRAAPQEPAPVEPPPSASIAVEAALLRDAQAQLRARALAQAEALLDEHRTRFPDGQMRDEREAIAVLVACASGSSTEIRERARTLLGGPHVAAYEARIRSACGL